MKYQEKERQNLTTCIELGYFGCNGGGKFLGKKRDFVLQNGDKNLFAPIRKYVKDYFRENGISWWSGAKPTGHVLSSQIACINHLYALRYDEENVLKMAQTVCEDFVEVLKIQSDKYLPAFIAFEVVSDNDYLHECKDDGKPTRGNNCTSIDALIYAKHKNGKKYLIPIEWKYTEYYGNEDKAAGEKGIIRKKRYTDLINNSQQLKNEKQSCYYFEPFYQLMHQTLWAEQMIKNNEREIVKADDFIHVHVIPTENKDLLDKKYLCSGKDMETTWRECLKNQNKYKIISPKTLLNAIDRQKYEELIGYLGRYNVNVVNPETEYTENVRIREVYERLKK